MGHELQFFIDGEWVHPITSNALDVIDPATEEAFTQIALGTPEDINRAVQAARRAFSAYSQTTKAERLSLLRRILDAYNARYEDLAQTVSRELGAPIAFAREAHAYAGQAHLMATIEALEAYVFECQRNDTRIVREAIGVVGMITPWNWPLNQIVCKVAPALAAGCTMILKPSEIAPLSGILFAEILDTAGVPDGVFNLVNGTGPEVGQAISSHPDIDMVSFTGSTPAGINVAKLAADTIKRVTQELGGKSANIILPDADLGNAVRLGVASCFANSGQSCDAPTRMLVPLQRHAEALHFAKKAAEQIVVSDPQSSNCLLGPVVSRMQFEKIQRLIERGIAEGAELVTGGAGRPIGFNRGYFVRPTIFGNVTPDMTIAREEIFGPILAIMPYLDEDEAIRIANDTPYGLAAYIQSTDLARARRVALQLRAGSINLNYSEWDLQAPFGGYKASGNGREYGIFGIEEFLETKAIVGFGPVVLESV